MNPITWYKLESRFGAGHQGEEIRYFFEFRPLSDEEERDYAQEESRMISQLYDCSCFTDITKVDRPPLEVIKSMVENYKSRMRADASNLIVLEKYLT